MTWVDPHVGFEFRPETVSVTEVYQREKHAACGLTSDAFDGHVDPSFFITLGIQAGIHSGISAEGNINMVQSLVQHRPARIDEPLTVHGRITEVTAVPRGLSVFTDVWFDDAKGERVISAARRSLKPDPAGGRGAGERPAPVVADPSDLPSAGSYRLTPDGVKAYSSEGNSIHYDMAAAQRAGFRAPMIGGAMGVHFLMLALWSQRAVSALDLEIYFRRPIFWDDAFVVALDRGPRAACLWREVEGVAKVLTEARVNRLA